MLITLGYERMLCALFTRILLTNLLVSMQFVMGVFTSNEGGQDQTRTYDA
jgi:hypothetical protein